MLGGGCWLACRPVPDLRIRLAEVADAEAIRAIYNVEVTTATSTFDLVPRIARRPGGLAGRPVRGVLGRRGRRRRSSVVGFASLSPYKERAAYRTTVEDSVYVDRGHQGRGHRAAAARAHVVDVARASGFHAVMARIEASGTASRALHAACGFELVGIERQVGRKFNRWLDVAVMQRLL